MPARSKIDQLPPEIRAEFQQELVARNFSNYEQFEAWFAERGYQISRSAAARFGKDFQSRCDDIRMSTEMAKSLVGTAGDDEGNLNEATIRMVQTMTFDLLLSAKKDEGGKYDVADILPKIGVMVAKLSKASVDQKKWVVEMRKKATATADEVVKVAKEGGLSNSRAEAIKKKILGIV
jgi:hypothetical protein